MDMKNDDVKVLKYNAINDVLQNQKLKKKSPYPHKNGLLK